MSFLRSKKITFWFKLDGGNYISLFNPIYHNVSSIRPSMEFPLNDKKKENLNQKSHEIMNTF